MDVQQGTDSSQAGVVHARKRVLSIIVFNAPLGAFLAIEKGGEWKLPEAILSRGNLSEAVARETVRHQCGIRQGVISTLGQFVTDREHMVILFRTTLGACRDRSPEITQVAWLTSFEELVARVVNLTPTVQDELRMAFEVAKLWPAVASQH